VKAAAVFVVVLAVLWGYTHHAKAVNEHHLATVARDVAGRDVAVHCQGLFANLVDVDSRSGSVHWDVDGPGEVIFLTRDTCRHLQKFWQSRSHAAVDCLLDLEAEKRVPARSASPAAAGECAKRAEGDVFAILTLAHESYHRAGVRDEGITNCYAIQAMAYTAVRLGAQPSEGRALARFMLALLPYQPGDYAAKGCYAGGPLDLHPETPEFPTEHDIAPPEGLGAADAAREGSETAG
jgi:hypothetical protein